MLYCFFVLIKKEILPTYFEYCSFGNIILWKGVLPVFVSSMILRAGSFET